MDSDPKDRPDGLLPIEPTDDEWADGGFSMGEWMDPDLDLSCDTENPESCESCT